MSNKLPVPFGRHLLLERINVGGMAEVFKAKAFGVEGFERIVAVKRILPTLVSDQEFITMFIDEARIAAHLTHQNIVQIYELGKHEETFYISMEYVAGKDLRQILDFQKKLKKPMAIPKACYIVSRVCEALEYAHRKKDPAGRDLKIIHRDVTPQNVIISYEGEVKLCDFGIAKAASRVSRTQVGVLKGKFAYMSPEQVRGQPTDRRSDLFALGAIFYEMLTGERLFLADSDYTTLENVRNAIIPSPREYNPAVSEGLEDILFKLLAAEPRERYQWASEVHEDLLDHLVQNGRLYHGRHLRQNVQETYGRDIEIENEKLEAFMRLKMPAEAAEESGPKPSNVVMELAKEGQNVAVDPADLAPPEDEDDDLGGPTDAFAIPNQPFSAEDETESSAEIGDAAAPTLAGASPVASLFGAPELDESSEDEAALTDGEMVVVAAGSDQRAQVHAGSADTDEEPVAAERTLYDAIPPIPDNDTVYDDRDDHNETEMGDDDRSEIDQAQAELIEKLESRGVIEGATVDAAEISEEHVAPDIYDPAESDEEAPTFHGDELPGGLRELDDLPDDSATNVSPLILEDNTNKAEIFESDDGTLEDAEAFVPTKASGAADRGSSNADTVEPDGIPAVRKTSRSHRRRSWSSADRPSAPRRPPPPPGFRGPGHEPPIEVRPVSEEHARPFAPQITRDEPSESGPRPSRATPSAAVHVETRGRDRPQMLMLVAGAVGLIAAIALGIVVLALRPDAATLQIVTEPTRQVIVIVDGFVVAEETPFEVEDLTVGEHKIELRAEGFTPYRQTIKIAEHKPHSMVVPLERAAKKAPVAKDPPLPDGDAPPPEEPDEPDEPKNEKAGSEGEVAVAPPPPPAPPPDEAAPPPTRAPPPPAPPPPRRRRRPTGTLMVSTTPPGVAVLIDGKDTGQRTPIRRPYSLPAGRHTITFLMNDGKRYSYPIQIDPGQTLKMRKLLR